MENPTWSSPRIDRSGESEVRVARVTPFRFRDAQSRRNDKNPTPRPAFPSLQVLGQIRLATALLSASGFSLGRARFGNVGLRILDVAWPRVGRPGNLPPSRLSRVPVRTRDVNLHDVGCDALV